MRNPKNVRAQELTAAALRSVLNISSDRAQLERVTSDLNASERV